MARKDIGLKKTITDAVKLLQDSIAKRGIEIEIDCENAPREIRIQESKFHQMMVNLVKNAVEAIDEREKSDGHEVKPSIRIRAYVQEDFLVVDVVDSGIGIEEKNSRIIFAAGYTTKEKGSGLGLHSIANFIIGSGGQVHALSPGTGKGTTMRVKLRLASVALKSNTVEEDTPMDPNSVQSEVDRAASH
ncbi:MAG: HAMP domain-containing histidine kinase [Acidobacteria bacterium]|nr:HAMP domain-containing histidine kinase [Acidobacteriota bacterium]